MSNIFQMTARPNSALFFHRNDTNDIRLGEIVSFDTGSYKNADVVILGCPQDDGVKRNGGRIGAGKAPEAIRTQFYKLSNFGISLSIFDIGDTIIQNALEETHQNHYQIVAQILRDRKLLIVLGGGNDISYPDGKAMSNVFGATNWAALNIDAHFDVRADQTPNSGTPYRQLLDQNLLKPENFFELAYQEQSNSPIYFEYLNQLGVNLYRLAEIKRIFSEIAQNRNLVLSDLLRLPAEESLNLFFGFDVDSVRSADAPGVSAASPLGLSAEDFVRLTEVAGCDPRTRVVEFTEMNPRYDIDNRTAKLVATAMHSFIQKKANPLD